MLQESAAVRFKQSNHQGMLKHGKQLLHRHSQENANAVPVNPGTPLLPRPQGAASKDVEDGQHLCKCPSILGQHNASSDDDHPLSVCFLCSCFPVSADLCQVVLPRAAVLVESLILAVAIEPCAAGGGVKPEGWGSLPEIGRMSTLKEGLGGLPQKVSDDDILQES